MRCKLAFWIALFLVAGVGVGRAEDEPRSTSTQVEVLEDVLEVYEEIAEKGGWNKVPKPNDRRPAPFRRALKKRLETSGDYRAPKEDSTRDVLFKAIAGFQRRHGLKETGLADTETIEALNVPVEARIAQLEVNIKRWQEFPIDLGPHYIFLNIPAYELRVIENNRVPLRMRAIVGRPRLPTPTLVSAVTYFIINPYWNVPTSIAVNEMLDDIRRDPTYLSRNRYQVLDASGKIVEHVDWATVDPNNFSYRIRQDFGGDNALGQVKFVFPNPYSVYLHDTDDKSLFPERARARSHGCVRIEKPKDFALYLAKDNSTYTPEALKTLFAGQAQVQVLLKKSMPLYIGYFTAEVDTEGTVYFWKDIYKKDKEAEVTP